MSTRRPGKTHDTMQRWCGLHVLADDDPRWPIDPVAQAEAACRGGARVVQLRTKHATDRETITWAHRIREITKRHQVIFVLNDRFDIAIATEADAVHLGQTDLPPTRVAAVAGDSLAIGRSTHTLLQARSAIQEPVDYVAFGPTFDTRSKASEYSSRGVDRLRQIVAEVSPRPVVAIGGIGVLNLSDVLATGAHGAAVISAVADADDPVEATRELVALFETRARQGSSGA